MQEVLVGQVVTPVSPKVPQGKAEDTRRVRLKEVGAAVGVAKATPGSLKVKARRKARKKRSPKARPRSTKPRWASSGCSRAKEKTPGRGTESQKKQKAKEKRRKRKGKKEREKEKEEKKTPERAVTTTPGGVGRPALARDRLETRQWQPVAEHGPVLRPRPREVRPP